MLESRHPFVDEKGQKWGTLKGHVTVRAAGAKAIERPWNTTVFRLNLYILTGQASEELRDPFITVELEGDELESQECPAVFVHENGDVCNFYRRMTLEIKLPSSSKLLLKMFNKNRFFSGTLIGEARLDVEDRCLALQLRRERVRGQLAWLRRNVAPRTAQGELLPHLAPAEPEPIETVPLLVKGNTRGSLRMWMDIADMETPLPEVTLQVEVEMLLG